MIISSAPGVVDAASLYTDADGDLFCDVGAAGTAVLTAIWNANIVGQIAITVSATSTATTAVVTPPADLIAEGESVDLAVVITDQYGTVLDNSGSGVTFDTTNCDAAWDDDTLAVTNTVEGSATVDIMNGATKIGTISFTVYAAAEAASITGVSTPMLFEVGGSDELAIGDVSVLDQYGRAFTPAAITLTETSDPDNAISIAGTTITGDAAGTATVQVQADGVALAVFSYDVTVVAGADIDSYALADMGPIQASSNPAYFATPVLVGIEGGEEVVLADDADYDAISSSNLAVATPNGLQVEGVAAGTATISAYKGGELKATGTVTVVSETLVATTVTVAGTAAVGDTVASVVTVEDQYGVVIAAPDGTYYVDGVVAAGTDTLAAGTYTVKFIATNGVMGSGDVVVS
jgi:hypothetical protein